MVQTPSIILKSDYRFWDLNPGAAIADVYKNESKENSANNTLYEVLEFVISKDSQNLVNLKKNQKAFFLPIFGKIKISGFNRIIDTEEVVIVESAEDQVINIKNVLNDAEADVLVMIFDKKISENSYRINQLDLQIRNKLNFIDKGYNFPGFIGVFDGREEGSYVLKQISNKIFAMVINGAFEFQNRLLENRDAIVIWDLEELEFEALSENAIILFFEFQE